MEIARDRRTTIGCVLYPFENQREYQTCRQDSNAAPCTFNKANPKERPNKVIEKQIAAELTISGLAYGKTILITSVIVYKEFK
jgi:hypothetical protein